MIDLAKEIKSLYKQKIEWLDLKEEGELNKERLEERLQVRLPSYSKVQSLFDFDDVSVVLSKGEVTAIVYRVEKEFKLDMYDRQELFDPYNEKPEVEEISLQANNLTDAKKEAEDIIIGELDNLLFHIQELVNRYVGHTHEILEHYLEK